MLSTMVIDGEIDAAELAEERADATGDTDVIDVADAAVAQMVALTDIDANQDLVEVAS